MNKRRSRGSRNVRAFLLLLCAVSTTFYVLTKLVSICVCALLLIFKFFLYIFFTCANIYRIKKALLKRFEKYFCWRNLHAFMYSLTIYIHINRCANCYKNGNRNFPIELVCSEKNRHTHTNTRTFVLAKWNRMLEHLWENAKSLLSKERFDAVATETSILYDYLFNSLKRWL